MDTILKILLPIYLILFFSIVFIWRTYYVWKQTGVNPFKFRNADNAQSTIGKAMSFTWVLCIIIVSIHSISDQVYSFLIPINWLEISLLSIIGLVILTISLGWVIIAQSQMGNAWRIGIDSEHPSGLVQTGIFARSRNPIFLGMIAMLLGLLIHLTKCFKPPKLWNGLRTTPNPGSSGRGIPFEDIWGNVSRIYPACSSLVLIY